jgi:prefoldin subunit 5
MILGCNFYCDGQVEDPSKIFVAIGMGFYLEFTLTEAEDYINKKVKELEDKGQNLTDQVLILDILIEIHKILPNIVIFHRPIKSRRT